MAVAALLALAACDQSETHTKIETQPATAPIVAPKPSPTTKKFDFYVLALSWSPSYCEAEGTEANQQQCGKGRPYAFVVHGLWPQFERGFPKDCETDVDRVPDALVRSLYDIMPSAGLIGHQWRRHGSCSGLDMEAYFATLRSAREKVAIPAEFRPLDAAKTVDPRAVEQAFTRVNQKLPAEGISTSCDKRFFREVRVCLTKDLAFRACPELERRSCRASKTVMPPVRG